MADALGDRLLSWLPLVRKLRAEVQTIAKDRDRLMQEVATYRHAFETTATDRDRLAREAAHAPAPQVDTPAPTDDTGRFRPIFIGRFCMRQAERAIGSRG